MNARLLVTAICLREDTVSRLKTHSGNVGRETFCVCLRRSLHWLQGQGKVETSPWAPKERELPKCN